MEHTLTFDLGTFEGFNFRNQSAIERILTAQEVIDWDHDKHGEAEFWPSGEVSEVTLIFIGQTSVTASELIALDTVLEAMGGDDVTNYLKIHYAQRVCGISLGDLTEEQVEDQNLHIFMGRNFTDVRREAAYELFELYWPDAYKAWESCNCDGLVFDTDRFLDSPAWSVEEVMLRDQVALIVVPQ